jgi:hypothetical protein
MPMTVEQAIGSLASYSTKPLEEFKDHINSCCCQITGSTLSYFATMNAAEDVLTMIGWSRAAMVSCVMMSKPIVYKMPDTGLWGDAVRERKAVITNDYKNLVKPTKKGYPKGHVQVRRHMNLPILEGRHIAMVVGVGNKAEEYTQADARALEAYMNAAWSYLKPKLLAIAA